MVLETIKPVRSLVEQTYDILLDAICAGELEPGARLAQDRIAAELNVSRQPVNSAISILKANGFAEDTGRRGVVVSPIDPAMFRSIYEFRAVIDPFAARLAARRVDTTAKLRLDAAVKAGFAAANGEVRDRVAADIAFHDTVYALSGNQVIVNAMKTNWHHLRRSMAEVARNPEAALPVWQEHEAIAAHILAGEADEAERRMRAHVENAQRKIERARTQTA